MSRAKPVAFFDLRLMPELSKAVSARSGFAARAWVAPGYRLAKVHVNTADAQATLQLDELQSPAPCQSRRGSRRRSKARTS